MLDKAQLKLPAGVTMVRVALSADLPFAFPLKLGANTTDHCPVPPGAIELGPPVDSTKSLALVPLTRAEVIASGAVEEGLLSVIAFEVVVLPSTVSGMAIELGLSEGTAPLKLMEGLVSPSMLAIANAAPREPGEFA